MQLFTLTEKVRPGIIISRDDSPHIEPPEGASIMVMLDRELTEFIEKLPPGVTRLRRADISFVEGVMVLKPSHGPPAQQALVRVGTMSGIGGKVSLTAEAYEEDLCKGRVRKLRHRFPSTGVQPLCTEEWQLKLATGVDESIDILVIMSPGSSFRIERTGNLIDQDGTRASPELFVRWTGRCLHAEVPKRFRTYGEDFL